MKSWTNVLIGAVIVAAVLYALRSSASTKEGFETSPGSIIGMVFAGILGVGIIAALIGSASGVNSSY